MFMLCSKLSRNTTAEIFYNFSLVLCVLLSVSIHRSESASILRPRNESRLDSTVTKYEHIRFQKVDQMTLEVQKHPSSIRNKKITPFGNEFKLLLRKAEGAFLNDAQIEIHDGRPEVFVITDFNLPLPVEGNVVSIENSKVSGYLHDGTFQGKIHVGDSTYFVEPARMYFEGADKTDAIIYEKIHSASGADFCKPGQEIIDNKTMDDIQSALMGDSFIPFGSAGRKLRVCKMKVVSDHYFLNDLHDGNVKSAIADMEYHIQEADRIFRSTDFDDDGNPDGIRIRVAKAVVYRNASDYTFSKPKLTATEYLKLFSLYDHDGFCAALAFSYQKIPENTLGYAYRGGVRYHGGICFRRRFIRGLASSMNVGMVSFDAPWGKLPKAQSSIVVTHEIGHMFGSPHDEFSHGESIESSCAFKDMNKQYIMSSISNPGTSKNNRMFSHCSRRHINENIKYNGNCLICKRDECGIGRTDKSIHQTAAFVLISTFAEMLLSKSLIKL